MKSFTAQRAFILLSLFVMLIGSAVPATAFLSAPYLNVPGGYASGSSVRFDWTDVGGATDYYYELATDSSFNNSVFYTYIDATTSASEITINGLPDDGTTFYWMVCAIDTIVSVNKYLILLNS